MKTLKIVSICILVLMASAAFAANIPVYNGSFEILEQGHEDENMLEWSWLQAASGATYTSMLDPNAHDGDRVLLIDMSESEYGYVIGPWGSYGLPGIQMVADAQYTVSAWMKKVAGHACPGGGMFVEIGSTPGTWNDYDRVLLNGSYNGAPALFVDEQWVQYSIVLDTAANPGMVGKYIAAVSLRGANAIADDTAWVVWDDVRIDGPVVPEPSSLLALGTSLVGLAGFVIRRRK